jgi:hypothetical protein
MKTHEAVFLSESPFVFSGIEVRVTICFGNAILSKSDRVDRLDELVVASLDTIKWSSEGKSLAFA